MADGAGNRTGRLSPRNAALDALDALDAAMVAAAPRQSSGAAITAWTDAIDEIAWTRAQIEAFFQVIDADEVLIVQRLEHSAGALA